VHSYDFKLPDLGEGTVESEIVTWHVQVGDQVNADQPVVDMMTDKANIEITAPVAGMVMTLAGKPGDIIPVGASLMVFEVEDAHQEGDSSPLLQAPPSTNQQQAAAVVARPLASPAVRKQARESGIRLADIRGSGPEGRITKQDLQTHLATGKQQPAKEDHSPRAEVTEVRLIGLRRQIADKMAQSKRSIPDYGYIEEVDVTELESLRRHLNNNRQDDQPELSYLPLIMQALIKTLQNFPVFNAHYDADKCVIRQFTDIHIGFATQTSAGLKVPVVRYAASHDLWSGAIEIQRLAQAARNNSISREELTGSTMTITSLGKFGGIAVLPIINYPEIAIIGINRAELRPVVRDNQIVIRRMMNISSAFDHRVVDGYQAAQMIHFLKDLLEHPAAVFV
jgi:2-oxoisovalerate dehydrogenase E2 component (dihydrolipoyl transacylase)